MLLLKSESEGDLARLTNLDWLDDLTDWLEEQNKNKNFPNLGDKTVEKSKLCKCFNLSNK